MLNFASLFNQYRSQPNGSLSELLDQPSTKIGRLLDEESFVNEYKSGNARVAEFMKYEKFEELIELLTVVGPPEDKKRSYKYPLAACDLLSIDSSIAIELFFPEKPLTVDEKVTEDVQFEVEVEVEQTVEVPQPQAQPAPQPEKKEEPETIPEETSQEIQTEKSQGENEEALPVETQNKILTETPQPAATVPEKRIRKEIKKEIRQVEKVVKKQLQPLINKLAAYFSGEVNYTLAGYVSKVLSQFFVKKPADFLRFFLQESVSEKILNHAQSRSVGDLIVKVLVNETTICLEQRKNFFKSILNKLSISSEVHIMSNLSAYVCQIIQKVATNLKGNNKITEFNDTFFSLDVITQVIKNVISEQEHVSIYNAPILFTYLTSIPFTLPEDESVVEEFKKLLEHFIVKSTQKFNVTSRTRPKLGTGRIKIIEILRFILKENILNTRAIVASHENLFSILVNLMRQYPLNNLLHNEISKIFEIALTQSESSALNSAILKDNILLNFISEQAEEDKKIKAGASIYKSRKGFIAHLINLAMKIKEVSQTNETIKRLIEGTEFSKVYESFIEKEVFNSKKTLAGFSMRKDIKHEIMFQKEDIITTYASFLQKCPAPVFDTSPEHVNIEHPDLVEELQKQLEQNLTVKPKQEKEAAQIVATQHPESPVTEAQVLNQPFWVAHLQYNVEDLMIDL